MELLLNLAWLLLAIPAYWLWCASKTARVGRKFTALQCLLALGCMLVVLFPVVSATDDLRAMRAEMEESPSSKRAIRQASSEKAPSPRLQSPPALAGATKGLLIVNDEEWHQLPSPNRSVPATPIIARAGRAPPASFPG